MEIELLGATGEISDFKLRKTIRPMKRCCDHLGHRMRLSARNGPLGCYDDELPDAYHPDIRMEFEWKNRDPVSRPSRGSLFLGNPEARIFEQESKEAKRGTKRKKGTFLLR